MGKRINDLTKLLSAVIAPTEAQIDDYRAEVDKAGELESYSLSLSQIRASFIATMKAITMQWTGTHTFNNPITVGTPTTSVHAAQHGDVELLEDRIQELEDAGVNIDGGTPYSVYGGVTDLDFGVEI